MAETRLENRLKEAEPQEPSKAKEVRVWCDGW